MTREEKLIRPFADIEPEIRGRDFKEQRVLWHIATPKTVGSQHFWFGISVIPRGVSIPAHSHVCEEMYFLLEGQLVKEVEGKKYTMLPYDVMYFPPGVKHQTKNLSKGDAVQAWIYAPIPQEVSEEEIFRGTD